MRMLKELLSNLRQWQRLVLLHEGTAFCYPGSGRGYGVGCSCWVPILGQKARLFSVGSYGFPWLLFTVLTRMLVMGLPGLCA